MNFREWGLKMKLKKAGKEFGVKLHDKTLCKIKGRIKSYVKMAG